MLPVFTACILQMTDVSIARRKTLNSGGILPLALGLPALLAALSMGLRMRRRASH